MSYNKRNMVPGYSIIIDGLVTCNFPAFSTVIQSDQDNGSTVMKFCMQWNSLYNSNIFGSSGN